ncbi:hypothetical protein [Methanolobus sp.]|uniref:hypothetical protein n=1 Tax=Methanolobus sp. TaxID=1874737 RepID=UPI0025DEC541|nr:hypothetical protein [Methanolobus sp.]
MQNPVLAMSDTPDITNNSSSVLTPAHQAGISEYSHLIELSFDENNYIVAGEALVYSTDSQNKSEELALWIPENADIMQFQTTDMMATVASTAVNYSRNGNLLYFNSPDISNSTNMPLLYGIRYSVHSHEEVTTFNKVLREENVFGYPVSRLIIIVNHGENEVPAVTSADGTPIIADESMSESNQTSYIWSAPQFTEFMVTLEEENYHETSKTTINPFIISGILVVIIIATAIIYYRKGNSEDMDELRDRYEAELAVIAKIEEDYKKNKLSKDEFESILKKHSDNASSIKRKMEKLENI